ncbi:hypothetical protein KIW84_041732 [Lathyrus oleraceus]|uniref:Uncharacterized protein n=1 Tax=Pisum sativum TaxID=3888 RepID=A0A9D4XCF5_PEA|nr:hypothetical protein KIW84_041732 [Pisum sativum]
MLALGLIGIKKFGTALVLLCKCHATITSLSVVDTHKRSLSEEFNFEYMAVHVPKSNTATFHFFTKKLRYNNDAEEENAYVIRKQLKNTLFLYLDDTSSTLFLQVQKLLTNFSLKINVGLEKENMRYVAPVMAM